MPKQRNLALDYAVYLAVRVFVCIMQAMSWRLGAAFLLLRTLCRGGSTAGPMARRPAVSLGGLSRKALTQDLQRTHDLLSPYGDVRWFRPGSAFYNGTMLKTAAV